jgi:DNA gyrase subunit B
VDGAHIRTLLLTFFFRHMVDLVQAGRVYMAQPPLYRIKRDRVERYLYDDKQLHETLVELALEEATLAFQRKGRSARRGGQPQPLGKPEMRRLLNMCRRMEVYVERLQRTGMDLAAYLAYRRKSDRALPQFRATLDDKEAFFYSESELDAFIRQQQKKHKGELEVLADSDTAPTSGVVVRVSEFHDRKRLEETIAALEEEGLDASSFSHKRAAEEEEKTPLMTLSWNGSQRQIYSPAELAPALRDVGRAGLTVRRFKGLGEMTSEELAETAMNPATRVLLRIKLVDMVKADEIFSILVGKDVECRRNYIKDHALEVRNLDI